MTMHPRASLHALVRVLPICKLLSECVHDKLLLTATSVTRWSYFGYFEPLTSHGVRSGVQTRLPMTLRPVSTQVLVPSEPTELPAFSPTLQF